MKLHELFEKSNGKIASKDPKVIHAVKTARAKYHGRADDDLSALISMMGDEQKVQDKELDSLDSYNMDQDVEINDTERVNNDQEEELADLRDRINRMQGRNVTETNDTRSFDDWVELVVLTGSQYEKELMQVVMNGDEDTALHMFLKDVAHEVGVPEHMRNGVAYNAANQIPIPGVVEESEAGEFGVFMVGGSIGSKDDNKPSGTGTKEEMVAKAKRMTKHLSPGERKYYKMRYVVRPINESTRN